MFSIPRAIPLGRADRIEELAFGAYGRATTSIPLVVAQLPSP